MSDTTLGNIRENWKFFVLIFLIGMAYADQKARDKEFYNLNARVEKKIKILNEVKQDVVELNKKSEVEAEREKFVLHRLKILENK